MKLSRKLFFIFSAFSLNAYSAESDLKKVEDILDRLERRIMDQEGASTSYGDAPTLPKADVKQTIQGKPSKVTTDISENNKLKEIASAISEIEQQVDKLESDVQKTKQKILESSSSESSLDLNLIPPSPDKTGIRYAKITMDGLDVYELSQPSGIWAPRRPLPIFNGPISAGVHKLEVEVNLVDKNQKGLPINQDSFKTVRKTFNLNISARQTQSTYTIYVRNKPGVPADLELKSKDLPREKDIPKVAIKEEPVKKEKDSSEE